MKDAKFKIGDVVQLRSGGPRMTVLHVAEEWLECLWFNNAGELQQDTFPPTMISLN